MKPYKIIILFLLGILIGWFLPDFHSPSVSNSVTIHDTLKTNSITYKLLPGTSYNIDSLITVINQFWKDSLKNLYGHGLFESKFTKTDDLGIRNYTYTSRIPPDPESELIIDESFAFPKRSLSIITGLSTRIDFSLGAKYYLLDHMNYSLTGTALFAYEFVKKTWTPNVQIECEYRF